MAKGKWTQENFEEHHKSNPLVYIMFKKFALQAAAEREYYSAKIIFYRMRWYTDIEEKNSEFKIDDGWISHYARKFMDEYPEHNGFFKTRKRSDGYFK